MIIWILIIVAVLAIIIWGFVSYNKKWNNNARLHEENIIKALKGYSKLDFYFDWAKSTTDEEIKEVFGKNETTGAVSMKTIDAMDHLDGFMQQRQGVNMIWRSLYKLPTNYYSSSSIENKADFDRLCINFDKVVQAKKKNHIDALDSVMTLRVGLNEYRSLLEDALGDIAKIKLAEGEKDTLKKFLIKRNRINKTAKIFIDKL